MKRAVKFLVCEIPFVWEPPEGVSLANSCLPPPVLVIHSALLPAHQAKWPIMLQAISIQKVDKEISCSFKDKRKIKRNKKYMLNLRILL